MAYHYRIVHGSFKNFQKDVLATRTDKDERFCQTHTVVAVASLCSLVSDITDWNATKIDHILIEGDLTFCCIETKLKNKGISISNKTIERFIQLGFKSRKNMIELVSNQSFFGTFGSMLNKFRRYMEATPIGFRRVLFKSKKVCFGIFDFIADDMSVNFCLFDPNGRNENGFYDYDANPCILHFKRIENLFELLERDDLFNHTTVECIPIRKITIPNEPDSMLTFPFERLLLHEGDELSDGEHEKANSIEENPSDLKVVRTRYGRNVEQPFKYQCESHPSFWRGKERQDADRLKRNNIDFAASKTNKDIKIRNARRRLCCKLKTKYPGFTVGRNKKYVK